MIRDEVSPGTIDAEDLREGGEASRGEKKICADPHPPPLKLAIFYEFLGKLNLTFLRLF